MRHVPGHVKGGRPAARDPAGDAARHSGVSVSAAFAMIRKEIQDLRRQPVEPAVFERQLHELAAQISALQETAAPGKGGQDPDRDAFLQQLKALLSQNLTVLQQQVADTAATAISGPAESIRRDVASLKEIQASVDRRTQDTFEAVYGTIERIVDRLAAIEEELRERGDEPEAGDAPPSDKTPPVDDADRSGTPAADQPSTIPPSAALEALGLTPTAARLLRKPAALPESAADAASSEEAAVKLEPVKPERLAGSAGSVVRTALKKLELVKTIELVRIPFRPAAGGPQLTPQVNRQQVWIIGLAGAVAMLFAVTLTLDFYYARTGLADAPIVTAVNDPVVGRSDDDHGADTAAQSLDQRDDAKPDTAPESNRNASLDPKLPPAPVPDVPETGAAKGGPAKTTDAAPWDADTLMQNLLLPASAGRDPWPQTGPPPGTDVRTAPLPPTIGSKALVAAAQAGDPGACYEIGIRFAEGRNTTVDLAKAAAWLDRAAQAGLAPAQFRLGSMYEKGLGVRRNFAEARRLYMAAAAQGHAKAMHNLAVLYARGINGRPDYDSAIDWFRRAAAYGTIDSQYNLGILYARGSGVERDLVESWKWFALAAKGGDKDAAHKRDEVAKGLDASQLEAAKAKTDAFVPMLQPDEAITTRAPAGGWDQAAATPKSRPSVSPPRSPPR